MLGRSRVSWKMRNAPHAIDDGRESFLHIFVREELVEERLLQSIQIDVNDQPVEKGA